MSIQVTTKNFSDIIFNSKQTVLLTFLSSDKEIAKKQKDTLHQFALQNPHILVANIDSEKEPGLVTMYKSSSVEIPSVKVFKNGRCIASEDGVLSQQELLQFVSK